MESKSYTRLEAVFMMSVLLLTQSVILVCSCLSVWGQCEVICERKEGVTVASYARYGLMPDGTSCIGNQDSFVEKYKLIRSTGMLGYCVQGFCQVRYDLFYHLSLVCDVYIYIRCGCRLQLYVSIAYMQFALYILSYTCVEQCVAYFFFKVILLLLKSFCPQR